MEINRCFGCMSETAAFPCPHCGFDPATHKPQEYVLRLGSILNGKYLVGKMLGQGGFGITYVGWDLALERKVAIKEYYPSGQVSRHPGSGSTLQWYSTEQSEKARRDGMEMFLKEARKMSRVDNIKQVVRVRDLFQENGTAYIVMDYIEGETLKTRLQRTGPMSWEEAKKIFLPVIQSMGEVHKAGLIHRDISPDNLMLEPTGGVKILDLGAAKDLNVNTGASSMRVAKGGFSPVEQYTSQGGSGGWSDVYAMAATMYYTLTGQVPPTAVDRMKADTLRWDLPNLQALPRQVLVALQRAMAVMPEKRTQTMEDFYKQLTTAGGTIGGGTTVGGAGGGIGGKLTTIPRKYVVGGIAAILAIVLGIGIFGGEKSEKSTNEKESKSSSSLSTSKKDKKDTDWESEVDELVAAGVQGTYNYRNGAKMELYFDEKDNERCRIFYNADGKKEFVFKANYNEDGKILEELGYDGSGTLMRRKVYEFNNDKVARYCLYGQNNVLMEEGIRTFDSQGRSVTYVVTDGSGKVLQKSTTTYDGTGASRLETEYSDGRTGFDIYNADGDLVEYCNRDANGKQDYRGVYTYDSQGNRTSLKFFNEEDRCTMFSEYQYEGDKEISRINHNYDEDGKETVYLYENLFGPGDTVMGERSSGMGENEYRSVTEYVKSMRGTYLYSFSESLGSWKSTSISTYDWDGTYISYISYDEEGRVSYESVTTYDENGEKTGSIATYHNRYNNTKTVTKYDADYNKISEETFSE